ncbi:MAG: AbrB/MazE/SpoVT family DNA-binding domain-containing protein [Nanohaloarchaea archaeon SW_7_43_1]|nr:MAG: AbrB/MazE/SpoVT family DNA-binding domain-containing protein [Nanohaloarchaea archaeon SW_7_43_1]
MKLKRKVGDRGQVTLPKDLRDQLGILPNTEVYFSEDDGKVVLEKKNESFSDWAKETSEKIGKLDKSVKDYRKEQMESRLKT